MYCKKRAIYLATKNAYRQCCVFDFVGEYLLFLINMYKHMQAAGGLESERRFLQDASVEFVGWLLRNL